MEKHSVGQTIATLRKKKGWTQVQLAEKLQVSDKAVSKWEKDASYPSIEFLPILADLFEVTIDYIVTGRDTTAGSRLEYCAKVDNPTLAYKFSLSTTDEHGNTLMDYVIKHDSVNVFTEICNREDFEFDCTKYDIAILYRLALLSNRIDILERYKFKKSKHISDRNTFPKLKSSKWFRITDELLDAIALDNRIDDDTISYLLSYSYSGQDFSYITWAGTASHFLHRCYLHGKRDLIERILSEFKNSNAYAYKNITIEGSPRRRYSGLCLENGGSEHAICKVLKKTIDLAISKGDDYYLKKFNQINDDIKKYCEAFYLHLEKTEQV